MAYPEGSVVAGNRLLPPPPDSSNPSHRRGSVTGRQAAAHILKTVSSSSSPDAVFTSSSCTSGLNSTCSGRGQRAEAEGANPWTRYAPNVGVVKARRAAHLRLFLSRERVVVAVCSAGLSISNSSSLPQHSPASGQCTWRALIVELLEKRQAHKRPSLNHQAVPVRLAHTGGS